MRKCKSCRKKFEPRFKSTEIVCSPACALKLVRKQNEIKRKEYAKKDRADMKKLKESLLTHKDYIKMTQVVFNTFIRTRDKGLPCVSCGCNVDDRKTDASHYWSAGANPNVRFNEDNVHNACVPCNQFFHGNLIEYGLRLPSRIGQKRFDALMDSRNSVRKYSVPELKEMIVYYKRKTKELK